MFRTVFLFKAYTKLTLCFLFFAIGCLPDESHFEPSGEVKGRIMDQLRSDPDFSTFTEALELTGLADFLNRSGLWTVIAPTNEAFTNAGIDINDLPARDLQELVEFHVLERMMFTFDFAESRFSSNVKWRYATSSDKFITVSTDGNSVNGVPFITEKKDIEARNGAIHGVAQVMFPDPSIDIYIGEQENLSIFYEALQKYAEYEVDGENSIDTNNDGIYDDTVFLKSYDLPVDLVNESVIKTVYAPSDAAFQNFFSDPAVPYNSLDDFNLSDIVDRYVLTSLINAHLATGVRNSSGNILTSGNETVTISPDDVQTADIAQSNGVIHILNKVIYPPSFRTVSGLALLDKDLSKFATALIKSALIDDFAASNKVFTMFAPSNAAFELAGIDPAAGNVTPLFLDPILRYHVIPQVQLSTADMSGKVDFLLTNHGAYLKHDNTSLHDNQGSSAAIISADLAATNGLMHKVDHIMMPPDKSVADLIGENSEFSQFIAALTRTGRLNELEEAGVTVFAPVNAAFFEMYTFLNAPGGLTDISIPRLDSIISYHLIPTRIFSPDLTDAAEISTQLEDMSLIVKTLPGETSLLDANSANDDAIITQVDNQGINGVVHVIDAVLLPDNY